MNPFTLGLGLWFFFFSSTAILKGAGKRAGILDGPLGVKRVKSEGRITALLLSSTH